MAGPLTGLSEDPNVPGVKGEGGTGVEGRGVLVGVHGVGGQGIANTVGVRGDAAGIPGLISPIPTVGVLGISGFPGGIGLQGINQVGGVAGDFQGSVNVNGSLSASGDVKITGKLSQNGDVQVTGNIQVAGNIRVFEGDIDVTGSVSVTNDLFLKNRDVAERFRVEATANYQPGMLMVIGESGALEACTSPYDRRVIGVISGAGTHRPAVTLAAFQSQVATVPVALVGTVFCLVDADLEPVKAGDLITSSETPGHAMRASDPMKSFGAIVGKALEPLSEGRALIPIVISLQ
jgi:cytoskeletal protein CcmA (bactofilin family)